MRAAQKQRRSTQLGAGTGGCIPPPRLSLSLSPPSHDFTDLTAVLRGEAGLWARPVRVRAKGAHAASPTRGVQSESYAILEGTKKGGLNAAVH